MQRLTFSTFEQDHIKGAHLLSQAVQWPHRAEDWAFVRSLSKGVVVQDDERVVGTALGTPFGSVATANMIIVDQALRGNGLGRRVMEQAMALVQADEWRLIATRDGLPLYEKLGFTAYGEIAQHQGIVGPVAAQAGVLLSRAGMADLDRLVALDKAATGMDRRTLYQALLSSARISTLREDNDIVAFAALRLFGRGHVLGPVIARNEEEAKSIMTPLMAECEGKFLRIDTTTTTGLGPWLARQGLVHAGGGVQMRRGVEIGHQGPQASFALAAQALG